MPRHDAPLTTDELARLDDAECVPEDLRPWGVSLPHAFAHFSEEAVELERLEDGGITLRATAAVLPGLPLVEDEVGRTFPRDRATRVSDRELRLDGRVERLTRATPFDAHRPGGFAASRLPRSLDLRSALLSTSVGRSARGGRVHLSDVVVRTENADGTHTTVINGESREFLRPTHYPYTAVCKLELWRLTGGTWAASGAYATGFLVGPRVLMTSGHAFDDVTLSSGTVAIRVIPACWANQPVFGPGLVTWVRGRRRWHSDSGNDLQVCRLADPVGDRVGWFGTRGYDSDWEDRRVWTMAGFPFDRSTFGMSVEHGIAVRDDDDGDDIDVDGERWDTTQVESDADDSSGASGSPLFAWFGPDNPCAIGVHSGTQVDWTAGGDEILSCAAGGDGFLAVAAWGRHAWD